MRQWNQSEFSVFLKDFKASWDNEMGPGYTVILSDARDHFLGGSDPQQAGIVCAESAKSMLNRMEFEERRK